jgi:putative transposase
VIGAAFDELSPVIGVKPACDLLGHSRAGHYRRQRPPQHGPPRPRPASPNALTVDERARVLSVLHEPEHLDLAVTQVWARLLDESVYLCSIATMSRILRDAGENRERRRQRTHPAKTKPQLQASAPNQVWSWDITKLQGPARGTFYDLYVIIDIYSRYVVAWTLAPSENAELARDLIADAIAAQGIDRDQLTIHADRGSSMTSKPVAQLLVDLGVTRTHSRPHVSNDNPYSEAQFRWRRHCRRQGRRHRRHAWLPTEQRPASRGVRQMGVDPVGKMNDPEQDRSSGRPCCRSGGTEVACGRAPPHAARATVTSAARTM